jgi:ABC-type ATPase with predicted acetyltransferase domain
MFTDFLEQSSILTVCRAFSRLDEQSTYGIRMQIDPFKSLKDVRITHAVANKQNETNAQLMPDMYVKMHFDFILKWIS